jgi:hypothetical protein
MTIPQNSKETIPDMSIEFETKYVVYAISVIKQDSVDGKRCRSTCRNKRATNKAIPTPIAHDPIKTPRKLPRACIISTDSFSSLFKVLQIMNHNGGRNIETHRKRTIATASLSILSPKMIAYKAGSTFNWLKTARTVTVTLERK